MHQTFNLSDVGSSPVGPTILMIWVSGLNHLPAKEVSEKLLQQFESVNHRHLIWIWCNLVAPVIWGHEVRVQISVSRPNLKIEIFVLI